MLLDKHCLRLPVLLNVKYTGDDHVVEIIIFFEISELKMKSSATLNNQGVIYSVYRSRCSTTLNVTLSNLSYIFNRC